MQGRSSSEIHPNRKSAGEAAAQAAADELQRLAKSGKDIAVIFATGASQFDTLDALTSLPGLPWGRMVGFHLDEYVGLDENHPASFRRYLREKLTSRVPMRKFHEIDGRAEDLDAVCREYVTALHAANPQLCLLGIGENGHLAFNDPAEADFNDPEAMKVVTSGSASAGSSRQPRAGSGVGKRYRNVHLRLRYRHCSAYRS